MSLNVLVVDDSAVMRQMIIKVLRLSGIQIGEVFHAGDGREGMRVLEEKRIDLVLCDIHMPVMSGEEMIEQILARPDLARTKVIVISMDGSMRRTESLHGRGIGFVHKPFTPEIMRERIREVMGASDESILAEGAAQGDGPDF